MYVYIRSRTTDPANKNLLNENEVWWSMKLRGVKIGLKTLFACNILFFDKNFMEQGRIRDASTTQPGEIASDTVSCRM